MTNVHSARPSAAPDYPAAADAHAAIRLTEMAAGGRSSQDPHSLRYACDGLWQWMELVVQGLNQIWWTEVGREQSEDERLHGRPLYNMMNPNAIITEIIQRYQQETAQHLDLIRSHVLDTEGHAYQHPSEGQNHGLLGLVGLEGSSGQQQQPPRQEEDEFKDAGMAVTAPPERIRDHSLYFSNSLLAPSRQTSSASISGAEADMAGFPAEMPQLRQLNSSEMFASILGLDVQGTSVYYIIAKDCMMDNPRTMLGCPAFDFDGNLVGFYIAQSEHFEDREVTTPRLVLVDDYPAVGPLAEEDIQRINAVFADLSKKGDSSVFCISEHENESRLVETAMIYYYDKAETFSF